MKTVMRVLFTLSLIMVASLLPAQVWKREGNTLLTADNGKVLKRGDTPGSATLVLYEVRLDGDAAAIEPHGSDIYLLTWNHPFTPYGSDNYPVITKLVPFQGGTYRIVLDHILALPVYHMMRSRFFNTPPSPTEENLQSIFTHIDIMFDEGMLYVLFAKEKRGRIMRVDPEKGFKERSSWEMVSLFESDSAEQFVLAGVGKQGEVEVLCGNKVLAFPVLPASTRAELDVLLNVHTSDFGATAAGVSEFVSTLTLQTPVVVRELDIDSKAAKDSIVIDRAKSAIEMNGQMIPLGAQ
jgi:hypothetical protein